MKPLSFKPIIKPEFTLDVSPLTPDKLAGKKLAQIKRIYLSYGKQKTSVDKLFAVSGNDTANIRFLDGTDKLLCVGQNMSHGSIEVQGDVGNLAGQHMRGGIIIIHGNAGAWTGNSMKNGHIEIMGNTGDFLGAGLPGDPYGMSNGLIFVKGNAGDRAGDRMRRGMIIINGNAGDYCGSRMGAGTIIILNKAGKYSGFGMKRGTIILAKQPRHISATFKSCGNLKMQFLRLLFKQLSEMGNHFAIFKKYGPEVHRFAGDLASNGKGEILILQTIKSRN
jgi:formylmethanofuran dehydrogenase subunit C